MVCVNNMLGCRVVVVVWVGFWCGWGLGLRTETEDRDEGVVVDGNGVSVCRGCIPAGWGWDTIKGLVI